MVLKRYIYMYCTYTTNLLVHFIILTQKNTYNSYTFQRRTFYLTNALYLGLAYRVFENAFTHNN